MAKQMLLLTLVLVIAVPLSVELLLQRVAPNVWAHLRWGIVPPLGGAIGALVPMGALPMEPFWDGLMSLVLGTFLAALIAVYGLFRELCFTGPTPADVARSGRRSAYRGPVRL